MANKQIDSLQGEIHHHHDHVERLLAKVVQLEHYLSGESENRTQAQEFENTVHKLEEECANWREKSQRERESWRRHYRDLAALVEADLDPDSDADDDVLMRQLHDRVTERLASLASIQERDRIRFEEQLARQREQLDTQLQQLTDGQQILIEREAELERARNDLKKRWNDLDRAQKDPPIPEAGTDADELRASLANVESQRDELQLEIEKLRDECERLAREKQQPDSTADGVQSSQQDELERQLADERSEVEELRRQLQAETEEQLTDLRQREAELAERMEEFDQRIAAAETQEQTDDDALAEDLAERCEDLMQQLESARVAREEAESALENLRRELSETEATEGSDGADLTIPPTEELQQEREQLAHDQEQLRSDQELVRERQQRLDESFQELARKRRVLEEEHEEWRQVRGQIEEKLGEHIDHLGSPVFSSIDRDFVGLDESEEDDQDPEEIEFSTPDDSSPVDTSDLRRFFPEDQDAAEGESSPPESVEQFPAPSGEIDQDDQMISDYMQRLLNREGSSSESPGPSQPAPAKAPPVGKRLSKSDHKIVVGDAKVDTSGDAKEPIEYAPRIRAPELDLSMMRDIANESARSAINRYSFKVWLHAAVMRWSVSAVAFATGVVLLYWAQDFSTLAGFSGLAALVISLFWLLQGLWLTRFAWRSRIRYSKKNAAPVKKSVRKHKVKAVNQPDQDQP